MRPSGMPAANTIGAYTSPWGDTLPTIASSLSATALRAHDAAWFGSKASSQGTISIGRFAPPAGSLTPPAALMALAAACAPAGTSAKCTLGPVIDVRTPSLIGAPLGLAAEAVVLVAPPPDEDFLLLLPHAA